MEKIADDWNSMRRRQARKSQMFNVRIDKIAEFILFHRRAHCAFNANFKMSLLFVNFDFSNIENFELWGKSAGRSISFSFSREPLKRNNFILFFEVLLFLCRLYCAAIQSNDQDVNLPCWYGQLKCVTSRIGNEINDKAANAGW